MRYALCNFGPGCRQPALPDTRHGRAAVAAAMAVRRESEWITSLSNNRAGRVLATHLASIEARSRTGSDDNAGQEVLGNERVFMAALARALYKKRPFPCGLPNPIPHFVAILNLSGERMLVYSDNPALLRCICTHSAAVHQHELVGARAAFEKYPFTRTDTSMRFVLLSYSLPWQAGTGAAFWHVSTCSIDKVADSETGLCLNNREWHFSSVSIKPITGKSVLDPRDQQLTFLLAAAKKFDLVSEKQVKDFSDAYASTCLDFDAAHEPTASGKDHGASLNGIVQALQNQRTESEKQAKSLRDRCKDLREEMDELKRKHEKALSDAETETQDQLAGEITKRVEQEQLAKQQHENLCAEMAAMTSTQRKIDQETKKARKEHERQVARFAEQERQGAAKDALHNAALSKHVATISALEGKLEKSREATRTIRSELEKAHASRLERERAQHAEATERLTGALESKKRIINQLSENNERRDVDVASLKTHADEQTRRIEALTEQLRKEEAAAAAANALAKGFQTSSKMQKALRQKETRSRHVSTHNASTSTHHCASTQTDPEPVPEPQPAAPTAPPAVGEKVVEVLTKASCSYQDAIDVLQELVMESGQAAVPRAMPSYAHPLHPHPHPHPHPHSPHGYSRPLPFPHFMPNGSNHPHGPYMAPHAPHYHNGSY